MIPSMAGPPTPPPRSGKGSGAGGRLLVERRGLIEASRAAVDELLFHIPTGALAARQVPVVLAGHAQGDGQVVVEGGPTQFAVRTRGPGSPVVITLSVGEQDRVVMQGGWWWRGNYLLADHPEGTVLTYQVHNLGSGIAGQMVPFTVGRRHRRQADQTFTTALHALGERLDRPTRAF